MGYKDKYKNMGRSNLTFLNADGGQSNHEAILAQIQKELDAELAKISYTDPQGQAKRDAVFADAERKIKAENARYEAEKAKRMDDLFGRIGNIFTTTQAGLTTLGITPPPRNGGAPVKGQDNYQPPANEKDNTLLIVGGVVLALGLVGFVIYKARK
jgi:hypothetical protein